MRVGVVGGGIVGLSAARFLAERGHAVTLYERFPMFHAMGSSHGRSRIVRRAYPDEFYTACMAEAYPMWADLERESGTKLVDECGLMYIGCEFGLGIQGMTFALGSLGVKHEVMHARRVAEVLPGARLDRDEVGIFTPEAGWVDAQEALRATYEIAVAHGLAVEQAVASREMLEANHDAFVVAAGAWITDFVSLDVRVGVQAFAYVAPRQNGPVWIDDSTYAYGIPGDPLGHKMGAHTPGPEIDPTTGPRDPDPEHLDQIRRTAQERFGIKEPKLEHVTTCLYTRTPDEDFRIGRLGEKGVFASACSGHGFKLGPWTGRILADIVEGKDAPDNHPRFLWPQG